MAGNLLKICFVDLGAYPLLTKKDIGFVGGSSVQQVILAEELIKHNLDIKFITHDNGDGERSENVGRIEVIKVYNREDSPAMSIFNKIRQIWNAMSEVDADIYFHESGCPGVVSLYCYLKKKKFIRYISSDAEVNKDMLKYLGLKGKLGNWMDIKLADAVIAQSEYQKKLVEDNFNRSSYIIKNGFPVSDHKCLAEKKNEYYVLWASTIRAIKQPELFLELARSIPESRFVMLGGEELNNPSLYNNIKLKSNSIPNLNFVGFVPFHDIDRYFQQASVFINTSVYEGFPNTFIQAWMNYTPTVTLNADPDDLICKNSMGFHSKTFDQMVKDVALLIKDEQLREEMGVNAREYVEKNHNIADIAGQYIDVFNRIMLD